MPTIVAVREPEGVGAISRSRRVGYRDLEIAPTHREIAPTHREIAPTHREIAPTHREIASTRREIAPAEADQHGHSRQ